MTTDVDNLAVVDCQDTWCYHRIDTVELSHLETDWYFIFIYNSTIGAVDGCLVDLEHVVVVFVDLVPGCTFTPVLSSRLYIDLSAARVPSGRIHLHPVAFEGRSVTAHICLYHFKLEA